MATSLKVSQVKKFRMLWDDEIAGAALYRALAASADAQRRPVLISLAEAEEKHAEHWAGLLRNLGVDDLKPRRLPLRVHLLGFLAKRLGTESVLPMVLRLEASDADKYQKVEEATPDMSEQERSHGRVVAALGGTTTGERIARSEGLHRTASVGGALRAMTFGANDGLVSNLLLIMAVAGGTSDKDLVLLAGAAGLLAGAFSMAIGEWVSIQSQRELYEHEISVEREELEHFPQEERDELALIYQAKGIAPEEAHALADALVAHPESGLDTLVREELGLDPASLGSPWVAALSSFVAFAVGAIVPVIPYLLGSGSAALLAALVLSGISLFLIGALITVFTGRRPIRAGMRMLLIGAIGAAGSHAIGTLIGGNIGTS